MTTTLSRADLAEVAERSLHAVMQGSAAELDAVVHPDATNREATAEPLATRGRGPAAFLATSHWLRTAYSDLAWTTDEHVVEGDLVVTFGRMSGRHTGDFVVWTEDGGIERVFVPTGKTFSVRHAHFQRVRDGQVVEHWAVRDDQGQAMQLGWVPPTPAFLVRCGMATRRARRALAQTLKRNSTTSPSAIT